MLITKDLVVNNILRGSRTMIQSVRLLPYSNIYETMALNVHDATLSTPCPGTALKYKKQLT